MESIKIAKGRKATLRVGPELEIPYALHPAMTYISEDRPEDMAATTTS